MSHPAYALLDVPIVRGPHLWTPEPIKAPVDIHPLPDNIAAYFVYPWTLEDHVMNPTHPYTSHAAQRQHLKSERERRLKYLEDRKLELDRQKKEALRRVAPGYESSGVLQPTRNSLDLSSSRKSEEPSTRPESMLETLQDEIASLDLGNK